MFLKLISTSTQERKSSDEGSLRSKLQEDTDVCNSGGIRVQPYTCSSFSVQLWGADPHLPGIQQHENPHPGGQECWQSGTKPTHRRRNRNCESVVEILINLAYAVSE